MKTAPRIVSAALMGLVGLLFALMTSLMISFLFKEGGDGDALLLSAVSAFLGILAYISFAFAWRCARGRPNACGSYISPWAVGFVGLVLFVGQIAMAIEDGRWKQAVKGLPISVLMMAVPVIAWKRGQGGDEENL